MNLAKRVLVCICLAGALVVPSTASAATRQFSGTVEGGGTITFKTKFKNGKTKKVLLPLVISGVPISCDQGSTMLNYEIAASVPAIGVKGNAFSFTTAPNEQPPVAETTGVFNKKGKKASGTFRDHGDFNTTHTNCDTGTVDWTAHKT